MIKGKKNPTLNKKDILKLDLPIKFSHFASLFPWPTLNSLRQINREKESNGFADAFRKYGKKEVVVFPARLFRLIDELEFIPVKERKKKTKND